MSETEMLREMEDLKATVARLEAELASRAELQASTIHDQYADYRLLRAMATIWIQQQENPLRTADELRKRAAEWQGTMGDETRILLETALAQIELAAEVVRPGAG